MKVTIPNTESTLTKRKVFKDREDRLATIRMLRKEKSLKKVREYIPYLFEEYEDDKELAFELYYLFASFSVCDDVASLSCFTRQVNVRFIRYMLQEHPDRVKLINQIVVDKLPYYVQPLMLV